VNGVRIAAGVLRIAGGLTLIALAGYHAIGIGLGAEVIAFGIAISPAQAYLGLAACALLGALVVTLGIITLCRRPKR